MNWHFERKECFKSSLSNSHRRENFGFCCRAMPIINCNIDAYSTIELRCLKISNLKEKNVFQRHQFLNLDGGTQPRSQDFSDERPWERVVRDLFIQSTLQATQTIIYLT